MRSHPGCGSLDENGTKEKSRFEDGIVRKYLALTAAFLFEKIEEV
jgi:hypothetical protein